MDREILPLAIMGAFFLIVSACFCVLHYSAIVYPVDEMYYDDALVKLVFVEAIEAK